MRYSITVTPLVATSSFVMDATPNPYPTQGVETPVLMWYGFSKIDVRDTSTKRSGWERVGVRNVFKSLKGFDDHLLAR